MLDMRFKPRAIPVTLMQRHLACPSSVSPARSSSGLLGSPGHLRLNITCGSSPQLPNTARLAGGPVPALLLFISPFGCQQGPGPEALALPGKIRCQHLTRPLLSSISISRKHTKSYCSRPWAGAGPPSHEKEINHQQDYYRLDLQLFFMATCPLR